MKKIIFLLVLITTYDVVNACKEGIYGPTYPITDFSEYDCVVIATVNKSIHEEEGYRGLKAFTVTINRSLKGNLKMGDQINGKAKQEEARAVCPVHLDENSDYLLLLTKSKGGYELSRFSFPVKKGYKYFDDYINQIEKAFLKTDEVFETRFDSLNLFDNSRNRSIPVALYLPKSDKKIVNQKIVIFSHGYYANKGGSNKECSYLTEYLASKGYFVASIQHELPTDDLIPQQGIPQVVRRPFWERGVENIMFVINELKKKYPELDFQHLILIGHSNGGDMSMLFGQQHPELVDKIISLDNRRVAFPRTNQPKLYSLRSSDQPADEGVLPTPDEQKKYDIKIIQLKNTIHNNMDNSGSEEQKKEINSYILEFLNDD